MVAVIDRDWFSGGRNIAEDPDAKLELADLIIELQQAVNAIPPPVPPVDPYPTVLDMLTTPPGAPGAGDRYCVNGAGAGAWAGHDYQIAEWTGAAWGYETYAEDDVLICSGAIVPGNAGLWQKTATAWAFLGATTVDPCLDIVLTDAGLVPTDGDRYLINGVGAGAFAGHDYEIAEWSAGGGAWVFTSHAKGTTVSVAGEITPANFGSYIKNTTAWSLIPAVTSALELAPNGRAIKGRYVRTRNQAGDYTFTGYTPAMGTYLVLGNTHAAAGTYYFRLPQVGSTPTAAIVTYGWPCTVAVPTTAKGPVVLRARNNAPICTIKPGEVWDLQARYLSGTTPASWDATQRRLGAGLAQATGAVWVDGGRTDAYTPTGSAEYPHKTIQAGLNACARGGLVRIRKGEYVENVVTVGDKHIDADVGTLLRSLAGDTLTFTDDAVPPPGGPPTFVRGLNVQAEDPAGWAVRVRSLGTWAPFVVLLDQVTSSRNAANVFWCEGGGLYLTDAGGTDGDAPICCRVGRATDQIGGQLITGRYNLNCAAAGAVFEIHENGYVMADGASINSNGPGAVIADMVGLNTPGAGCTFEMRYGRTGSPWLSLVRASGENVQVRLDNDYGDEWGAFTGDVFDMLEGGSLTINDGGYSSSGGRFLLFGRVAPPTNGSLNLRRVRGLSTGGWAGNAAEIEGNVSGTLADVAIVQRNGGASGTLALNYSGQLAIVDGLYEGPGPVVDLQGGQLWLLGGADIVPTGVGLPGSVPIAVAIGATLHRGHVNVRSGAPLIAGTENLLPSSFGMVEIGPLGLRARCGAGRTLPGGGAGYGAGSLFMLVPLAGQPRIYQNIGTEPAPTWVEHSYSPGVPGNWAVPAPTNGAAAWDRLAAAVAGLLGGPIP